MYAHMISREKPANRTCFYAESGGQVSDIGAIKNDNLKAKVLDVKKAPNGQHLHKVEIIEGTLRVDDLCIMKIMDERRKKIRVNHSMVHIIQKALQDNLSSTIKQAGSYVDDERMRFDFTFSGKIYDEDVVKIEGKIINNRVSGISSETFSTDSKDTFTIKDIESIELIKGV